MTNPRTLYDKIWDDHVAHEADLLLPGEKTNVTLVLMPSAAKTDVAFSPSSVIGTLMTI